MKTILVTGSTGLLGKGLEETLPPGCRILGLHQRDYAVQDAKTKHLVLDIRDQRKVNRLFASRRFDAVIHAAGIASVDYVEKHYAESLESNLQGTLNITAACRKTATHLIYISTNAVFNGKNAPYGENDPIDPVNKYGRIKVECEKLVSATLERWTIARPILMYGWNHGVNRPNPATWMYEKLLRGETIRVVDDVFENPLYNISCAQALWAAVKTKLAGVFHLAGADVVSRHQFALTLAKVFGLDKKLIVRVNSSYFPEIAARPKNTSFKTLRMSRDLGVKPLRLAEGLRLMKAAMGVKA